MCKLLATSNLAVRKQRQIVELTAFSAKTLGTTQRDGFGFALKHQHGVYGEKYLNPETCKGMGVISRDMQVFPKGIKLSVRENRDFSTFGKFPTSDVLNGSFISHGRTATCGKNINNTHPFQGFDKNGGLWTIAHNGVVDNIGEKFDCVTTCDSEHILNCFLYANGVHSLKGNISGYAACIGIDPNGDLFAFRDSVAPLYVSYIEELGICSLATLAEDVLEFNKLVCKHNKVKQTSITSPYMLDSYVMHTFKSDGTVITEEFPEFDRYTKSASAVSRSLGSAGVSGYGGYGSYSRNSSYPGYGDTDYYDAWEDSVPAPKQQELGITETKDFLRDPAIVEAIKNGELHVRDIADMTGEDIPSNRDEIEFLQNKIANEHKLGRKFIPPQTGQNNGSGNAPESAA